MVLIEDKWKLGKDIPGPKPPHFQAHHVVPRELRSNKTIKNFLEGIGFDFEDGARNGIMLPAKSGHGVSAWKNATIHRGSHPGYTKKIQILIVVSNELRVRIVEHGLSGMRFKLPSDYSMYEIP